MLNLTEWIVFHSIIVTVLIVDLALLQRMRRWTVSDSAVWMTVWVLIAVGFGYFLWTKGGGDAMITFYTGYLIEVSLSIDNVFLFAVIFDAFRIPLEHHRRVLFIGIVSAIVLRGLFITGLILLLERISWMIYPLGVALFYTGYRFFSQRDLRGNILYSRPFRSILKRLPVKDRVDGRFIVREGSRVLGTPLLLSLVSIEVVDIIFAVDSVPAILTVTRDFSIVYTSNILAVFCLRSLYFLIVGSLIRLRYLNEGLSVIMMYLGVKLFINEFFSVPPLVSLVIIGLVFVLTFMISVFKGGDVSDRTVS
ncbi:MAG: TerC/Alx family metal homeostasis membrane protein [Aigarchaeota archaeon]|nr:TerC/Alx family metal homeostasis membrane protein [Aigarchaeota archaeon]MDW8093090.1 TerC/Alx family metal homeostasis membrane protein [Nitrososphaerota archaeon]